MKNTTHRVVILKNMNSGLISQAILILKDSANENNSALLSEAEKIVEKYMGERVITEAYQNGGNFHKIFPWCVTFFAVCIAAVMYFV